MIRSGTGEMPAWCELEQFAVLELAAAEKRTVETAHRKQKLIVAHGACRLIQAGRTQELAQGANLDLPPETWTVEAVTGPVVIVYMAGRWGEETGGSGLFTVQRSEAPQVRICDRNLCALV